MGRKHRRPPWQGRAGGPPRPAHAPGDTQAAPRILGIDIGRVIIKPGETAGDTSFLDGTDDDAMHTPPSPGAFETIQRLVAAFDGRVWLVSKCGPRVQARTRRWLAHHRFFERTGLPGPQVRFCRKRNEKATICASLGIEAFIDDRPDVLLPMEGVVPWRYLFGPQRRSGPWPGLRPVRDWDEVAAHLLPLAYEQDLMPAGAPRSVEAPAR